MKKVFYFSVLALTVSALTLSCNKAVEEPAQEEIVTPVTRTFTCTFAEPDTKVAIDEEGKTTWKVGDQIFIHGKFFGPSYTTTVTLESENIINGGKTASFTVDLSGITKNDVIKYECEYFAAYPASAVGGYSNGNNIYNYNCFTNTNEPLMAAYLQDDTFTFYNLCGVLSFKVDGDYDQISFKGNDDESIFYSYYRVKIVPSGQDYNETVNDASSTIKQNIVADGETVNKIYFPNGAKFDNGFTISFLKDGAIVKTLSTTKSVTIARNEYRPMGDVTTYLKDYVAPTKHDNTIGVTVATATDLGDPKTANCYVVTAAGEYKFAAVKGNSDDSVGAVSSVAVLWETVNTSVAPGVGSIIAAADYDMQAGEDAYIVFKMPTTITSGNALIAAKDAADNILWSWHIWVLETPFTTGTFGGITDKAMMSRNLGALVDAEASSETPIAVESQGLLYQWGRKDPFPNSATFGNNGTAAAVSGTISWNGEMMASTDVYKYPNVFIKTGVEDDAHKDWSTDHLNSLWGATKTIYDPCPPGYKVPYVGDGGIWNKDANLTTMTGWEKNTTNHWFKVGTAVFPYAGYVQQNDAAYRYPGTRAQYHTATGGSGAYNAVLYGDSDVKYAASQRKGRAASVRCVAE